MAVILLDSRPGRVESGYPEQSRSKETDMYIGGGLILLIIIIVVVVLLVR
jgi:hypothetical protein